MVHHFLALLGDLPSGRLAPLYLHLEICPVLGTVKTSILPRWLSSAVSGGDDKDGDSESEQHHVVFTVEGWSSVTVTIIAENTLVSQLLRYRKISRFSLEMY
jgi:hypothetical protein